MIENASSRPNGPGLRRSDDQGRDAVDPTGPTQSSRSGAVRQRNDGRILARTDPAVPADRRDRPPAAALLDAVGSLIERVGPAGSGGRDQPSRKAPTAQEPNAFNPHRSHVPSPAPGPKDRPPHQPRATPQGACERGSLIDRSYSISRHLSRKNAPHRRFPAGGGKARARNEEKGGRGRKVGFEHLSEVIASAASLLARPGPPPEKGRSDSPPGPFGHGAEKRPHRSRWAGSAV